MIKITIESFDLKLNEQGFNNKINGRTWLELTFDPDDRVNKEEAMDIVRSVLLPGTHPIVEWPDNPNLREALNAVYQDLGKWQEDKERVPVGPFAYRLMEAALNKT